MQQAGSRAASAVSLGLSLSLVVLLLAMTLPTGARRSPPQPKPSPVVPDTRTQMPAKPDLGAVVLPPPPDIVPAPAPAESSRSAPARTEPPEPAAPVPKEAVPPARLEAPEPAAGEPSASERSAHSEISPPPAAPAPVAITPDSIREGRALLRLLEQGEGPDIEIAWPAAAADRFDLYRLFKNCFGMRTMVMTADGEVFDADGERSTAGPVDTDRYSGFARQPAGGLSAAEQDQIDTIRRRYGLRHGQVLRLFPRPVDAILLGALHRIAGGAFDKGVRIRARYQAADNGVHVVGFLIDDHAVSETIVLPYTAQGACRIGTAR